MGNYNTVTIELIPKKKFNTLKKLMSAIKKNIEFYEKPDITKDGNIYYIEGDTNWTPSKTDLRKLGSGRIDGVDKDDNREYGFKF